MEDSLISLWKLLSPNRNSSLSLCLSMHLCISASSSALVFVIFILLSVQVPTFFCAGNDTYEVCSKPLRCGTFQNVTYPFWGGDRPEYCGNPGMELTCQGDEELQITIMSLSYKVIEINTDIQAFTVARTDYLTTLCPQHLANTTLDFNLLSYAWNLENVTLYYDCPSIANQSSGFPSQFNCTSNGTNYYVIASAFGNLSAEAKGGLGLCRSNVIVPAFFTAVQTIVNNPTPDTLVLPLRNGFGLKWDANIASKCAACSASGGVCGYNKTLSEFTCYCSDRTDPSTCLPPGSSNGTSLKIKLIIGLGVAGAAIVVVCVVVFTLRHKRSSLLISSGILMNFQQGKKNSERIEAFIMKYGSDLAPKRYSFSDIRKITKSFKDRLGEGGFGSVYKGKLNDGRLVAVKVLSESKGDGEEFINEVASISRTSHVNVVTFLGFCYEWSVRALIYEFMPNGSLDKFIYREGSPDKSHLLEHKTLFEIAIGIARGLEYLHGGCNTRILHLDIKPHNILLDESFCPKISDFGLAKLCERKESILSMISARGTIGYIAPELFCRNFGGVSYKSDVYSYGMMVLEMVGAKENVHNGPSVTSEMNFPLWIYEHLQQEAYFNRQGITVEEEEITKKMIVVSLWCIQTNPADRPSMTKVLEMLQGSLQSLAIPPRPFLFSPPRSPQNSSQIALFSSATTMNSES
ncbi:PREDICTED: LEAF RUST 10 DISEASE-RESISTANCE LOCUS RECEPTOR-LIKE PROTEIN KINASE-like 2.1 isoform X1 [Theobroma cacao]|uniref:non-specific serine/threonine protein kinase n=1 Tax=Theobroma cacao TaxID=3641 RepID=A0AB32WN44_THECC|nr:PREDICTED: LEAF RUST 10 DISEASE-RESISTANCE LOCUS RECEPTOR-LIKE PROTEIN KINASE-like 2.1 isoform X1 [Theobroma cacao]